MRLGRLSAGAERRRVGEEALGVGVGGAGEDLDSRRASVASPSRASSAARATALSAEGIETKLSTAAEGVHAGRPRRRAASPV